MNASEPVLDSDHLPRPEENDRAQDVPHAETYPLRLLPSTAPEEETPTDSFKQTANLFGRALSALFR